MKKTLLTLIFGIGIIFSLVPVEGYIDKNKDGKYEEDEHFSLSETSE